MGRRIELVCDKCGKEIDAYHQKDEAAKIILWGVGVNRYNFGQRIDFCEECYDRFIEMYERFMGS